MATSKRKDDWRLCAEWLVRCQILVEGHRVTSESAQVFDLAQVLRDGVLICHLLNRLHPGAIDSKDFSQRPQMSQFLCLKNIRVFLQACKNVFHLEEKDLFEPYDLFEVKDFGKVIKTLAKLSNCPMAQKAQITGFSIYERTRKDDDAIYGPLSDIAVDFPPNEEAEYDLLKEDENEQQEKIYDDLTALISREPHPTCKRDYCIKEIMETEKNYTEALNMIITNFIRPLKSVIPPKDHETIFFGIEELHKRHCGFHSDLQRAYSNRDSYTGSRLNIPDCFVQWKEKFLLYGEFCSNLPKAQDLVDELCNKNPQIQQSVQECQMKANQGKFRLRDLLSVPMQRVLKYHLLLKELVKNTPDDHPEKRSLERALEEMKDLSLYVNEVKRDNEQLQLIQEVQNSITDLQMPPDVQLKDYGRIQLDGELKVKNHEDTGRNKTRYVFVFDKVMLLCKSRGDCYNFRDALVLSQYKVESVDNTSKIHIKTEKGWQYPFILSKRPHTDGLPSGVYTMLCKTEDMRKKWIAAIEMAQDNTSPEGARDGGKEFVMHTFNEATICDICKKLLRGVFFQGYKCQKTSLAVHKECVKKAATVRGPPQIPRPPPAIPDGPPAIPQRPPGTRCKATRSYTGIPQPPSDCQPALLFNIDDVIDVIQEVNDNWWKGSCNGQVGFFPVPFVRRLTRRYSYEPAVIKSPRASISQNNSSTSLLPNGAPVDVDLTGYPWYVGEMARAMAIKQLEPHKSGTYLIRLRDRSNNMYALSVKYINDVMHIKIQKSSDNHYYLANTILFRTIPELVTHYQRNTLGESFPDLPTTLVYAFKDAERSLQQRNHSQQSLGMCRALYRFSATQSNQLSLEVGDVIEIISRASGDRGWYKGRKGDRVGYFPAAYVSED